MCVWKGRGLEEGRRKPTYVVPYDEAVEELQAADEDKEGEEDVDEFDLLGGGF